MRDIAIKLMAEDKNVVAVWTGRDEIIVGLEKEHLYHNQHTRCIYPQSYTISARDVVSILKDYSISSYPYQLGGRYRGVYKNYILGGK